MKHTTVFTALLILGTIGAASAQQHQQRPVKTADEIARRQTDRMTASLGLDDQQQEAVYALNLQRAEKAKASRAELREKMAQIRADRQTDKQRLDEILTEEQRGKLQEQLAARKDAAHTRHHRGGRGWGGKRFKHHRNMQRGNTGTSATDAVPQES